MRRPLKPFVTEYKGSNRRGAQSFDTVESDRPKPFDPIPRPDADDSYEAAMRAADALFSAPPARPTEASNDTPPSAAPAPSAQPNGATPPPTGRILRVLDEAPSPELVALEAQHAPKRRGRKPGSKNKPKPPVDLLEAAEQGAAVVKRRGRPPKQAATIAAAPARVVPAIATLAALPNAVPADVAPAKANAFAARDEKRFPWVRDRLKPGEAWKRRRLPRVCW